MKIEAIFFDIDDTLCNLGSITADNLKILHELHEAGKILALATGRSLLMLPRDILQLLDKGIFSALVCANGLYNVVGSQIISHFPLSTYDAEALIFTAKRFNLNYQMAGLKNIAMAEALTRYDDIVEKFPCFVIDPYFYQSNLVYQFSYFYPQDFIDTELRESLSAFSYQVLPWRHSGCDVTPFNHSKARGIIDICKFWKIDIANVAAFGDSWNDIEMLQTVGLGVAMGNSGLEIQKHADFITKTIFENGIRHAVNTLNLL